MVSPELLTAVGKMYIFSTESSGELPKTGERKTAVQVFLYGGRQLICRTNLSSRFWRILVFTVWLTLPGAE